MQANTPYTGTMTNTIADLRKNYERGELDESAARSEPFAQFEAWLQEALSAEVPEPTAMTLATVGPDDRPSTRIVLMKEVTPAGIVFYTNYLSRKGRELATNPHAALQFHWVQLERVVRVEGVVEQVAAADADAYFASRPLASRIGAWASEQSGTIASRAVLVARAAQYGLKFGTSPPRPPHWGGYRLVPDRWEFWQGRASRLHDRLVYRLTPELGWIRERLAP